MQENVITWKPNTAQGGLVDINGATLLSVSAETKADQLAFPATFQGNVISFATELPASGEGMGAVAKIEHQLSNLKHLWIPHVAPYEDSVIGDHSLRSPALIFANDDILVALIPDIDDLQSALSSGYRFWLDYNHLNQTIKVAAGAYEVAHFHVAYRALPIEYKGQKPHIRLHILTSQKKEDLANPYAVVTQWLWEKWGQAGLKEGGSQRAPFSTYEAHVVNWAFEPEPKGWGDTVWQAFTINGKDCGAPAFIVDVAQHPSIPLDERRWREQRSVWNQAWFSTQRTANGLLRYARQIESPELEKRAKLITQVALSAPQTDGLFPSVYTAGGGGYCLYKDAAEWDQARWINSDRRPHGVSEQAYHLLDASFTARLLLEWHRLNPTETEAIAYVNRYAEKLCKLQQPDGSFPGWLEPDGQIPEMLAAGPETAMSASLLLDLAQTSPNSTYQEAAQKALDYLKNGPIKESRWEDFETYFSCSRWGGDFAGQKIERNGVYKSNTFSPFWCAEAFLAAYRLTKDERYLKVGRRCLDELSLYQQVWQPSVLPAPTHGGFGVMNADAEWNDARQSYFAPLYLEFYKETGKAEYFERGVSALRSSFAMMYCRENTQVKDAYERQHPCFGPESYGFMMENIAHGGPGPDPIGPFTIFTWGNGAALEAAAKVHDLYGDVYVDLDRKQAFGIDGCSTSVSTQGVEITDGYNRESLTVVLSTGARIQVSITHGKASLAWDDLSNQH